MPAPMLKSFLYKALRTGSKTWLPASKGEAAGYVALRFVLWQQRILGKKYISILYNVNVCDILHGEGKFSKVDISILQNSGCRRS